MSHFTRLKIEYKSQGAIVEALQKLGFTVHVHEQARQLEGYEGDLRDETAEIVVPRSSIGGACNELGFKWSEETNSYQMIISEYDQRRGGCAPGWGLGPKFIQQFTKCYMVAQIEASGAYAVVGEERQNNGDYTLVVEKRQVVTVGAIGSSEAIGNWVV